MNNKRPYGILSIVLGIASLVGLLAVVPALITIPLGIISGAAGVARNKQKNLSITGIILNAIAAIVLFLYWRAISSYTF